MNLGNILDQLNISAQCRKYGLSLWQCPQFIFLVMGTIIIFSVLFTYALGNRYISDPQIVALVVLSIALILFILAVIISRSFEKLAEANRMKTEFVSIVSHQLRSPISNLKWVIEFLFSGRVGPVSEKQVEYFSIIKENTSRMEELVSNLLIVSRIDQGKFPAKKEKISLREIIGKIVEGSQVFAKASNADLGFQSEGNLPEISIDPFQIKLVVENLLDNAIRYTKIKGEIRARLFKRGGRLFFEVEDQGVGIPVKDQKYIFQKFFRSSNALRHQTEGSGLGLYIAKAIIEKFKGSIKFRSQEGVGSTFWFSLPIK